jgi:FixJ family two-component response regulator
MSGQESIIYVVDDDADVRSGLKNLFQSVGLRAETFASPTAFVGASRPDVPSCLVLDVRFSGAERSGLEFQRELFAANIHVSIVFITGHGDIRMSVQAMKYGAVEFLTKPFRDQEILDAVRTGIERDRQRLQSTHSVDSMRECFATLSVREREIFALVTTGLLNKQVAASLGLSEITVKVHRGHVMRKMRAKSFADLVRTSDKLGVSERTITDMTCIS